MLALAATAWLYCLLATSVLFVSVVTAQVLVARTRAALQTVLARQARSATPRGVTSRSATDYLPRDAAAAAQGAVGVPLPRAERQLAAS